MISESLALEIDKTLNAARSKMCSMSFYSISPRQTTIEVMRTCPMNGEGAAIRKALIGGEPPSSVASGGPFLIKCGMSFTPLVIVILQRGARLIG